MKTSGSILLPSPSILSVNHQCLTSRSFQTWYRKISQDGQATSKRTTRRTILFLTWLKEWVKKKNKWEPSWRWLWSDVSDKIELWWPAASLSAQSWVTSTLNPFHILWLMCGLNRDTTCLYCFYFRPELTQLVLSTSSHVKRRKWLTRCLWVRVSSNLQEKLSSQTSKQEDGLFFRTVS